MYDYSVLIIDDNQAVLRSLKLVLNGVFKSVTTINNPTTIPGILSCAHYDVVLLDMNFDANKLDGEEGILWLNNIKKRPNAPAVVLITAFADIALAVRSLQEGADDFITKPWDNDELIQKILKAVSKHEANVRQHDLAAKAIELHNKLEYEKSLDLDGLEAYHIRNVLKEEDGNISSTAQRLSLTRQTLYNKMKKYGITPTK